MTAPWMPPLPSIDRDAGWHMLYTADQMRRAQADAARAALEQAARVCEAEEQHLWRVYKGKEGEKHEHLSSYTEGRSDQCCMLAVNIRAMAKEIT